MNKTQLFAWLLVLVSALVFVAFVLFKNTKIPNSIGYLILYSVTLLVIFNLKLTPSEIGLSRQAILGGLRVAAPFVVAIIISGLSLYFFKKDIFLDSRYKQTLADMIIKVLVILPITVVIIEELIFRGFLMAILAQLFDLRFATIVSSLLFGLWHVYSAGGIKADSLHLPFTVPRVVISVLVILATSMAGLFFAWLRIKSDGIFASILVHWSLNATGVVLAFLAWKK
ncbi:MAG: protease family protein [Patescibacteria group bacterium]|nr:protease family protein [Patescibacteria group bacterium]